MTPTYPDSWYPRIPTPERDRNEEKIPPYRMIAPAPVRIVKVAKFCFKELN
jgi:hypothetical protein